MLLYAAPEDMDASEVSLAPAPSLPPEPHGNRAGRVARQVLTRALEGVWLRQPTTLRVRVIPSKRVEVRAALARVRARLQLARAAGLDQRLESTSQALRALLAIAASAESEAVLAESEAVERGAERVRATLREGPRADLVSRFLDGRIPLPRDHETTARLADLYRWTVWLIDLESERERRLRRLLLRAGAAVAVVVAAYAAFSDRNLARGSAVTASSIAGFTPAPLPDRDRLSRLVDGATVERGVPGAESVHGLYAAGTEQQIHPWFTVDLGRTRIISEVVVYNRSDCCWGTADIPLALQVSDDNVSFLTVATRRVPFTDDFPWRQSVHGRTARYVRLWNPSDTPKNMVFSEIEIYGH
jgi:F5/8 type C domain